MAASDGQLGARGARGASLRASMVFLLSFPTELIAVSSATRGDKMISTSLARDTAVY